MKVLVTGATGFVGRGLLMRLSGDAGCDVIAAVRPGTQDLGPRVQSLPVGDLGGSFDITEALRSCEVVVHLAARVHVMNDTSQDPLAAFRRVNVTGTLNFARQAADAGVGRFIFLSSIKVNGEATVPGRPFTAADVPNPMDPYGVSKLEAERGLQQIARDSGMRLAIIRTPLVYGPGVKANFLQMMRWVHRGLPLPLGAITHNRRSLISLDNLVDLIVTCCHTPSLANELFLACDGEDLSTADLLQRLGTALGRPARLISVPPSVLTVVGRLTGRSSQLDRLFGSLQVDASPTRQRLEWRPPLSVDESMLKTARAFLEDVRR
jgi:nucleoside-diphosphate-sugar epimerase